VRDRFDLPDDYWGDTDPEVAERMFGEGAVPEAPEGMVDTSQYKKDGPWTVCFSNASVSNSWRVSMVEHVRYEVEQHPEIGTFLETDAEDKPDKQISDTEDLLAKGCDALIISPATQEALTPVTDKAMEMGVPVVTLDRNVSGDNYVTYVESSNCDMGREQAEWLVEALGGSDIVYRSLRIAEEIPLKGFPQLAIRRDRAPNTTGANLMGMTRVGDDAASGGIDDVAGHDGIVLVMGDALEDQPDTFGAKAKLYVYVGHHESAATGAAHFVLPMTTKAEAEGTFTNFQGRVQRFWPALDAPGMARPAWLVLGALAAELGSGGVARTAADAFAASGVEAFAGMTYDDMGERGAMINETVSLTGD
jgi:hypothetical protein